MKWSQIPLRGIRIAELSPDLPTLPAEAESFFLHADVINSICDRIPLLYFSFQNRVYITFSNSRTLLGACHVSSRVGDFCVSSLWTASEHLLTGEGVWDFVWTVVFALINMKSWMWPTSFDEIRELSQFHIFEATLVLGVLWCWCESQNSETIFKGVLCYGAVLSSPAGGCMGSWRRSLSAIKQPGHSFKMCFYNSWCCGNSVRRELICC